MTSLHDPYVTVTMSRFKVGDRVVWENWLDPNDPHAGPGVVVGVRERTFAYIFKSDVTGEEMPALRGELRSEQQTAGALNVGEDEEVDQLWDFLSGGQG